MHPKNELGNNPEHMFTMVYQPAPKSKKRHRMEFNAGGREDSQAVSVANKLCAEKGWILRKVEYPVKKGCQPGEFGACYFESEFFITCRMGVQTSSDMDEEYTYRRFDVDRGGDINDTALTLCKGGGWILRELYDENDREIPFTSNY